MFVKLFCFILLLGLSFSTYSAGRLEGISGSVGDSKLLEWFFNDDEVSDEEADSDETVEQLSSDSPYQVVDEETGCIKQKVYTLDVENPEQYDRLEDFPFTYECVSSHVN